MLLHGPLVLTSSTGEPNSPLEEDASQSPAKTSTGASFASSNDSLPLALSSLPGLQLHHGQPSNHENIEEPPGIGPRRSANRCSDAAQTRFKSIIVHRNLAGGFTEIWIHSPESLLKNSLNIQVLQELTTALTQAKQDTNRLVLLSGLGSVFSSGIDLTHVTGRLPSRRTLHSLDWLRRQSHSYNQMCASSCICTSCSAGVCGPQTVSNFGENVTASLDTNGSRAGVGGSGNSASSLLSEDVSSGCGSIYSEGIDDRQRSFSCQGTGGVTVITNLNNFGGLVGEEVEVSRSSAEKTPAGLDSLSVKTNASSSSTRGSDAGQIQQTASAPSPPPVICRCAFCLSPRGGAGLVPRAPLARLDAGAAGARLAEVLRTFLLHLVDFPKLLVVGVNGPALGLACAILPLADLIYASDTASFHLPYLRLGQIPEAGASYTLSALAGIPLVSCL
ncbi:unnamed protein product [Protopolystoma xenopodis]|uniref:3-hydroxyisobutyryl-CoA hydrolase, mitochondrial n=1 Tax=Protopolystoma xenopodis TaxID=117903 RepID=A0A448WJH6_9PLAT|nr:unnamed protein product [Protopolystoma xenopodis]